MGTRGAIGFIVDGKEKVTYNHYDSYPSSLGLEVLEFIAKTKIEEIREGARKIEIVDEGSKPSAEQKARLKEFTDLGVAGQSDDDWYCLLRQAQGNLGAHLKCGVMTDSHQFLSDSLFCEWAYLINLDTGKLEVYRGFNRNPKGAGRYVGTLTKKEIAEHKRTHGDDRPYYGVTLLQEHDLAELQKGANNRFGKLKPEDIFTELTNSWERQAEELREADERREQASKKPAPELDL